VLRKKANKPTIAIIGAGNIASGLAASLRSAGYAIDEIVSRPRSSSLQRARKLAREIGSHAVTSNRAKLHSGVIWFCVPDREIAHAAKSLPENKWNGKIALHSSGALTSDELLILRRKGALVASVHPLMTFVRGSRPSLEGVPFAIEGDPKAARKARAVVRDLGGLPFTIKKENKPAYHAWGMFASPLFTALLAATERVAGAAGITAAQARKRMLPILHQTLANYGRLGAAESFSGPIMRGDVETVKKHLKILDGITGARNIYEALALGALRDLPAKNRRALEKILRAEH
jgi:predicted short-subunit dehydrogenase-like oxidoreductase (DUF2520 family)